MKIIDLIDKITLALVAALLGFLIGVWSAKMISQNGPCRPAAYEMHCDSCTLYTGELPGG